MTIWIGLYRPNENYTREEEAAMRSTGKTRSQVREDNGFAARVRALPQNLPDGCRLVGSYGPSGHISPASAAYSQFPGIVVIETDDPTHATWYMNYYAGFLDFAFHPYTEVPRT